MSPLEQSPDLPDPAERLATWLATSDPRALWPHIDPAHTLAAHRAIAAAVRQALAQTPHVELAWGMDRPIDPLGVAAFVSGVGPMLGHWIERGVIGASPPAGELLAAQLEHARARTTMLETAFAEVIDALAARGLTATVLKGAHTARYFPESGTRPRSDLDVLVRPGELTEAMVALRAAGFRETQRTTHPWRSVWQHANASSRVRSVDVEHVDNPWSVDLHVTLDRFYFRGLWARFGDVATEPVELHGRQVRVLAQPSLLAFLAVHASQGIGNLRLVRLVELVLVIQRDVASGRLDWATLEERLVSRNLARFAWPALYLAERVLPGTIPGALLQRLGRGATPRMRRVLLSAVQGGMHLPRRSLDDRLMWVRGPREMLLNLSDLVWSADSAITLPDALRLYRKRLSMLLARRAHLRASPTEPPEVD